MVNPYDINGMKAALLQAYRAEPRELTRRMRAMRRTVRQKDVSAWARSFLAERSPARPAHDKMVQPASRS